MRTYTLKELSKSKDKEVSEIAKRTIKMGFPDTAQFEIVLRQVII